MGVLCLAPQQSVNGLMLARWETPTRNIKDKWGNYRRDKNTNGETCMHNRDCLVYRLHLGSL